jgi:hypothetical protein
MGWWAADPKSMNFLNTRFYFLIMTPNLKNGCGRTVLSIASKT